MAKLIALLFMIAYTVSGTSFSERRLFSMEIKTNETFVIFHDLEENQFKLLYAVIQDVYIFEYRGMKNMLQVKELISRLKIKYKNTIISINRLVEYDDILKPGGVDKDHNHYQKQMNTKPADENYFGMGIRRAWSLGYSGKGVTIAVTDVGINTDLLDLTKNIATNYCYNFINDSKNITPEFYHNFQAESAVFTDHGNNCASAIAATFGNGICSSGIAFNATIVGLKVFMVYLFKNVDFLIVPRYSSRSDIIARALSYNHTIDIYSNAWAPTDPFINLDNLTKDVIKYGAENGRRGLGIVYVFPAGPPGNGFANSIYTVAVNGVGRYGTVHKDSTLSSSVITSGLADGSNITAKYMLATSRNNKCVSHFKGVSLATAQVSAIIGLGLEANPALTYRDVQHLLVWASETFGKPEENGFRLNGAGRYFHDVFGYGLLNAEMFVTLAANMQPVGVLFEGETHLIDIRNPTPFAQEVVFCHSCAINDSSKCVHKLEHVIVDIKFKTACGAFLIVLISPHGTESTLGHLTDNQKQDEYTAHFKSVHFWDETAFGNYKLKITNGSNKCGRTNILAVSLTIYGTSGHTAGERQCRITKQNSKRNGTRSKNIRNDIVIYSVGAFIVITALMLAGYRCNSTRTFVKGILKTFRI